MLDDRREKEELFQRRSRIDQQILALLADRARLSKEWAARHPAQPATLPSKEGDTLEQLANGSAGDLPPEAIKSIFREIHATCRALEAAVRVAFAGPDGGFAHAAALQQFGSLAEQVRSNSAPEALDYVQRGRVDFAVLAYESSIEGPVYNSLLALRQTDLKIIAVNDVLTSLSLLCSSGDLHAVQKVYVTAYDRATAQEFLATYLPEAALHDVPTPLQACERAACDPTAAALAPALVGTHLGLVQAASGVAGKGANRICFCIVSARPASRTGHDATAIVFTLHDEPGTLLEVLKPFADRGVSVRTIHARPTESDGREHLFFIEITGHVTDRPVVTSLEAVKRQTKTLHVLGSYPAQ